MAKSYFAVLGVASSASQEEIHSAYRRLAKEFHPDHFRGGSEPFREIQEAYSVLGDARRRAQYRRSLEISRVPRPSRPVYSRAPEPLVPEQQPVDLGEISPLRSFQTYHSSYDVVFDWLWDNFSITRVDLDIGRLIDGG